MCKTCKNYVGLHNHTHYSLLDGYATIEEYIKAAKDMGMIGIGLADHGTASGLFKFIQAANKNGLIPVPGLEFYVAPENPDGAKRKEPVYYGPGGRRAPKYDVGGSGAHLHLTVFAYNNKGLENLFKLTSLSWQKEHYYYKPRIDTNMLAEHSEGLIVTTGCPSSEVNRRFLLGQDKKAYEYASRLKDIFGENLYVEIMNHNMDEDLEKILMPKLIKLSRDLDLPLIATNDSHYAFKHDAEPHERLLAVQSASFMSEPGFSEGGTRFNFSGPEYYLKSYEEMLQVYPEEVAEEALANTVKLAEKCKDIKLEYDPHLRPMIDLPKGYTNVTYLQKLISEGFRAKRGNATKEIQAESKKRINEEFKVLHSNDFIDYFLVVNDYIRYAHDNNISIGAGRGSVGGSEIAYVLDISNTDPIRFNLLFERFLSPGRGSIYQIDYVDGTTEDISVSSTKIVHDNENNKVNRYIHELEVGDVVSDSADTEKKVIATIFVKRPGSAPDVDTDFHTQGREKVIEYVVSKYGKENVANIITFGTFKAKSSFKTMCTIYQKPFAVANKLSALIPSAVDGIDCTIDDMFNPMSPRYNEAEDFRQATESPEWKEIIEMATPLDGRIKETGVHPCFVAGTLVNTSEGYKKIEEIKAGDLVLTHTNTLKEVVNTMINKSDDIYSLKAANSSPILVTGNHPMYVKEKLTSKNRSSGATRTLSEAKWVNVEDLDADKHLIGVPVNQKSELPNLDLSLPFGNKDFWWVIGRFVGDGWVEELNTKQSRTNKSAEKYIYESTTRRIKIAFGKEDQSKDELVSKVKSLFEGVRIEEHKTSNKILINVTKNEDLFEFLKMFGKYAHGKFIPVEVLNLPKALLGEFLNGYISADGSYSEKHDSYTFSTVSKELHLGLISAVNKVYNTHCSTSKDLRSGTTMIIEGRTVNVRDRYHAQFTKDTRVKSHSIYEDGYIWSRINFIEKEDSEEVEVYNLSVTDDNSYTVNNLVAHNCGVIISSKPLAGKIPIQVRQDDEAVITQWSYQELESLGFIKMDFLGLDTIDIIDSTLNNIASIGKEIPNMKEIINGEMDDKKTFEMLQRGDTVGVFQLGGAGVRQLLKRAQPTKFMDIATITALFRPGPMSTGSHTEWADRLNGVADIRPIHPELKDTAVETVLEETSGIVVFQESLMKIATDFAGMTPYESETLRKAMGKKKMDVMMSLKPKFIEGSKGFGRVSEEAAEVLWDTLEGFAQYGFNKCLASRTLISTENGKVRLEDLYKMYEAGEDIYINSMFEDGEIKLHQVKEVVKSGRKPLYQVVTESGKKIRLTKEHRLLTTNGYGTIDDGGIAIGKSLITDDEWAKRINPNTIKLRQETMSDLNRTDFMRERSRQNMTDYQATLTFEDRSEHQKMISETTDRSDKVLTIARERLEELRRDPEWQASFVDTCAEAREKKADSKEYKGFGKVTTLSNGMICDSLIEAAAGEYLISRGVDFEVHKKVTNKDGVVKVSDFYANGIYFEMDGLNRGPEYFREHKYGDDIPFVHMTPLNYKDKIDEALMKHHAKNGDKIIAIIEPKIAKNGDQYTEMTYDIEMMDNGPSNFIADGIVSHNSHSVSYAINAYQTAYLKANYPAEFMAALIQQNIGEPSKVASFIQEAISMGLKIGPVDINSSQIRIAPTQSGSSAFDVVYGFSGVKQVNESLSDEIVKERLKNGEFKSVGDFVKRISTKAKMSSGALSSLALAGAFDSFGVSRKLVVEKSGMLLKSGQSTAKTGMSLFDMIGNSSADLAESIEIVGEDYPYNEKIKLEADRIGLFISGHPTSNLGLIKNSFNPTTLKNLRSSKLFKNEGVVIATFTNIVSKVKRNGSRSIAVTLDDGTDSVDIFLSKNIVAQVEKATELARIAKAHEKGEELKQTKRSEALAEIVANDNITPIQLEPNDVYLIKVRTQGSGIHMRVGILSIEKLETAKNGSLPYVIRINSENEMKKVKELMKKSKGETYIKCIYDDSEEILDKPIKLTRKFIMELENIIGRENIITQGV